jgi:F-type H+-transporting ATPase subunit alpha
VVSVTRKSLSKAAVGDQVAIIFGSINGIMDQVPVNRVKEYETEFISLLNSTKPAIIANLTKGKLEKEDTDYIIKFGKELAQKYA